LVDLRQRIARHHESVAHMLVGEFRWRRRDLRIFKRHRDQSVQLLDLACGVVLPPHPGRRRRIARPEQEEYIARRNPFRQLWLERLAGRQVEAVLENR